MVGEGEGVIRFLSEKPKVIWVCLKIRDPPKTKNKKRGGWFSVGFLKPLRYPKELPILTHAHFKLTSLGSQTFDMNFGLIRTTSTNHNNPKLTVHVLPKRGTSFDSPGPPDSSEVNVDPTSLLVWNQATLGGAQPLPWLMNMGSAFFRRMKHPGRFWRIPFWL